MRRILWVSILALVLGGGVAIGWAVLRSPNLTYAAYEMAFNERFHRYDAAIADTAQRHGVDPMIVKAVVWRESRFRPDKVGLDGERGLMQITDAAAREWVKAEKIVNFAPADLFEPKTNLDAGAWLLARALHRYSNRDDPLPFALAEYNAGRSRVAKWSGEKEHDSGPPNVLGSREFEANIDIPGTRGYIETIGNRVQFYHERGRM